MPTTHFFQTIPNFSPSLKIINFFGFELYVILELFLNIEGVTAPENQRIICKSLLMSFFIIKQSKNEAESTRTTCHRVSSEKRAVRSYYLAGNPIVGRSLKF